MHEAEQIFEIKVKVPRALLQFCKRRHPAATPEQSLMDTIEELKKHAGPGVYLSETTMRELATVLDSPEITSEQQLIEAARSRFKVGENEVLVEIDPTLCYYVRQLAENEKISFRQAVANYFHACFANGYFNGYLPLSYIFFTQDQWRTLKSLLGKFPSTAMAVLKILDEWRASHSTPEEAKPSEQSKPNVSSPAVF